MMNHAMNRLIFLLFACASLSASCTVNADVTQVDDAALKRFLAEGVPIIDVRTPQEWQETGVIENSHLLMFFDPEGHYDAAAWLEKLAALVEKDQPFVLICRSGNRSGMISQFLDQKVGYTQVHNVTNGIAGWLANGGATVNPGASQ